MLFIDWRSVGFIALASALTIAPILFMWLVSRRVPQLWARIFAAIIGIAIASFGLGLTLLFILFSLPSLSLYSNLIASPNGKLVARTETWGGFGTEGGTNVKIYWLRGLLSSWVYSGSEQSVSPEGIRWIDNHTLEIRYTYNDGHTCDSTRKVRVVCLPVGTPSQ